MTPDTSNDGAEYDRWVEIQTQVLMPLGRQGDRNALIKTAEGILASETSHDFRQRLIMGVTAILQVHGWGAESLAWCKRGVAEAPDDPVAHSGLAKWYLTNAQADGGPEDLERAIEHSAEAVAKARASGTWRRYVLHDRCRIAVAAERYDIVAVAMEEILEIWPNPDELDIPMFETDWLNALPAGAVATELLDRYRAAGDRTGGSETGGSETGASER